MLNPTFLLRSTGYCEHIPVGDKDVYKILSRKYNSISISIKKNRSRNNLEQAVVIAYTASGYSIRVWNDKLIFNTIPALFREYTYLSNKLGCPLTSKQASKICELVNSFRDKFRNVIDRLIIYY